MGVISQHWLRVRANEASRVRLRLVFEDEVWAWHNCVEIAALDRPYDQWRDSAMLTGIAHERGCRLIGSAISANHVVRRLMAPIRTAHRLSVGEAHFEKQHEVEAFINLIAGDDAFIA